MAHLAAALRSARALPEVVSLLSYPPPTPAIASSLIGRALDIARPMAASAPQLLTGVFAAAASVQARSGYLSEALEYRRQAVQFAGPGGAPLEAVVLSAEQLTMGHRGGERREQLAADAGNGGRLGRLHQVLEAAADEESLVTALDEWVGAEHADDTAAGEADAPLTRGVLVYGGGDDEGWDPAAATGKPLGRPRRPVAVLEGLAAAHLLRGRLLLRHPQRRDLARDALSAALVRLEHVSDALRVVAPPLPDEPTPAIGRPVHPALALQAVFTLTTLGVAHLPPCPLTQEAGGRPPGRAADTQAADDAATDTGEAMLRRALSLARTSCPNAEHVPSWAAAYPLVGLASVSARRGEVVQAEGLLRAVADPPVAASAAAGGAGAVAAWVAAASAAARLVGRLSWNDQPRTADARAWAEKADAGARAWGAPGTVVVAEAGAPAGESSRGIGGGRVPTWWGAAVRAQLAAAPCAGEQGGGQVD
ncbi:hypothetical protein MMPV_000794 [Pyropia vietnamensis]